MLCERVCVMLVQFNFLICGVNSCTSCNIRASELTSESHGNHNNGQSPEKSTPVKSSSVQSRSRAKINVFIALQVANTGKHES